MKRIVEPQWSEEELATFKYRLSVGVFAMLCCFVSLPFVKSLLTVSVALVLNLVGCCFGIWAFGLSSFSRKCKGGLRGRRSLLVFFAFMTMLVGMLMVLEV